MRLDLAASAAGIVTSVLVLAASVLSPDQLLAGHPEACAYQFCVGWVDAPGLPVVEALAVLLLVAAVVSLVAPKAAYFGEAILAGVLAVFLLSQNGNSVTPAFWGATLLSMATTVVALLSARSRSGMSEQGNPMNLPVFG